MADHTSKLFLLLAGVLIVPTCLGLDCIACTSDGNSNPDCVGTYTNWTDLVKCGPEMSQPRCYVLYDNNKNEEDRWNRGCCDFGNKNDVRCLGPKHEEEPNYDRWRRVCHAKGCNSMDPSDNGSNEGGTGIIVVNGINSSSSIILGRGLMFLIIGVFFF